ncbi:MAG: potassium-transporting ATPase subunit KdpC [Rhodomicrobium sp.]
MKEVFLGALRASLVTWVLCGLFYPLALTGLGQLFFPFEANGSLKTAPDGTVIGSALIGQHWTGPAWFHGRPSATTAPDPSDPANNIPAPYNAANSAGFNLGPISKALQNRLTEDRKSLEAGQPELAGRLLPADMLTSSASGLDPDITPANAALQVPRVARARGVTPENVAELVRRHVRGRSLGIFGEKRVNVLELNLDLNKTFPSKSGPGASD